MNGVRMRVGTSQRVDLRVTPAAAPASAGPRRALLRMTAQRVLERCLDLGSILWSRAGASFLLHRLRSLWARVRAQVLHAVRVHGVAAASEAGWPSVKSV